MKNSLILEVNKVSKQYGKQQALDHFNLEVNKGESVAVAGPDGGGETAVGRMSSGITPVYDGDLKLFGSLDATGLRENRKYLGTIIEDPAFFPEMSAKQNLEFYRIQRGVKDKNRIDELLTLVGLADVGNKKFKGF